MLPTNDEIDAMSVDELKAFLVENGVGFGETALKPELVQTVRGFVTTERAEEEKKAVNQSEAENDAPKVDAEVIPPAKDENEALRMLQASGFKDKEELVSYLNVLEREKADIVNQKTELRAMQADLEQQDIVMKERERAVVVQAKQVADDLLKNSELYDKLAALKEAQAGLSEANT